MKPILSILFALLALSVTACDKADSPVQPTPTTAPLTASPGIRVEHSAVAPGKGKAMVLTANQSVSGSLDSGNGGQLEALGVRMGNYRNSADGSLSLKLCVEGACQEALMPLAGSKDNDFLVFELPQPIVLAKAQKIDYILTRSGDATNRVAVWAYPARKGQAGLTDPAGTKTDLVPRLELHLSK